MGMPCPCRVSPCQVGSVSVRAVSRCVKPGPCPCSSLAWRRPPLMRRCPPPTCPPPSATWTATTRPIRRRPGPLTEEAGTSPSIAGCGEHLASQCPRLHLPAQRCHWDRALDLCGDGRPSGRSGCATRHRRRCSRPPGVPRRRCDRSARCLCGCHAVSTTTAATFQGYRAKMGLMALTADPMGGAGDPSKWSSTPERSARPWPERRKPH